VKDVEQREALRAWPRRELQVREQQAEQVSVRPEQERQALRQASPRRLWAELRQALRVSVQREQLQGELERRAEGRQEDAPKGEPQPRERAAREPEQLVVSPGAWEAP